MKKKIELVIDPVKEARRYVKNAKDALVEGGKYNIRTNRYEDRKYVKAAGHYLWSGVLIILDAVFHVNEQKDRVSINNYRLAVGQRDRKLLNLVNDAYDILHLSMGYDGILNKETCDLGFRLANEVIDRCAAMLPFSPAA